MSSRLIINGGEKFGRWTLIKLLVSSGKKHPRVIAKCECGTIKEVDYYHIKSGKSKSCGCLAREMTIKRETIHGHARVGKITSEHRAWLSIIDRCYREKNKSYKDYGGRGIIVCERWLNSFENFIADMGKKPTPKHSIDRIDVNGNYEPNNCKWKTIKEQQNNRRNNHWIEHLGETKTIAQWADIYKTNQKTFWSRLWSCDYSMDVLNFRFYPQFLYLKEAV